MGQLEAALENVKKTIARSKSKTKTSYEEIIGQVSSYLVFLRSTVLSQEAANKLSKCLRERLVQLYTGYPTQGIELAAALCQTLYETKILTEFTAGNHEQKLLWDKVLNSLLSGVLDFYDEKPDAKRKETIGASLYPTLCSTFFSISISHMSVDLRCTGYALLSETADSHKANQQRLLDTSILGGTRLGSILWRTREFLVLESILNIFARMIPTTGGTAAGKATRTSFIKSVFVESSPDCAETGQKLAKLLQKVRTADWDHTATQVLDILATSNVAFPQPFRVTELMACDQVKSTDRLYVDEKSFVANILLDEDTCDSLSVPYSTVAEIRISGSATKLQESPRVTLLLNSLPIIGKDPITPRCTTGQTDVTPTVTFKLDQDNAAQFRKALKSRSLGHIIKADKGIKSSILTSPTKLEMDSAGQLIEDTELAQRIENLSQLYGTNDASDESSRDNRQTPVTKVGAAEATETSTTDVNTLDKLDEPLFPRDDVSTAQDPTVANVLDLPASKSERSASASAVVPTATPRTGLPLGRSKSQLLCDTAFGTSDDELSDIEDPVELHKPVMKASKDSKKSTTASRFAATSRRVMDSDDDLPSTPTHPPTQKPKKKLVVVSDEDDEIEEIIPVSKIPTSVISRRRSTLVMTPVVSSRSAKPKPLAASDTIDPGNSSRIKRNRNEKPILPTTTSHGLPTSNVTPETILPSPTSCAPDSGSKSNNGVPSGPPTELAKSPSKTGTRVLSDDGADLPPNSSPIAVQPVRKSVKSALRKKDGGATEAASLPSRITRSKRRRTSDDEVDDQTEGTLGPNESEVQSSLKKRRTEPTDLNGDETTAGTPSKARAITRYGGRKSRASPIAAKIPGVDYDHVPTTPPTATRDSRKKSSAARTKVTKAASSTIKPLVKEEHKKAKTTKQNTPNGAQTTPRTPHTPPEPVQTSGRVTRSRRAASEAIEISSPIANAQEVVGEMFVPADENILLPVSDTIGEQNDFNNGLALEGLHTSTPKVKEKPRRKSNRKPWQDIPVADDTNVKKATVHDQAEIPSSAKTRNTSSSTEGVPCGQQLGIEDHINDETMVNDNTEDSNVSKLNGLRKKSSTKAKEPVVDTTLDFPAKQRVPSPVLLEKCLAPSILEDSSDSAERSKVPRSKASVTFARTSIENEDPTEDSILKPTALDAEFPKARVNAKGTTNRKAIASIFNREVTPPITMTKPRARSPSVENITNVLNEIHEALLHKLHSNLEGVREEVRIGRERLLADASSDLLQMRGESITRYNLLIELEAEYATFGRNIIYGLEDLVQVNRKLEAELKKLIQDHNRKGISKKAPTSLFSTALPASISVFKA